jgi:hypothetical protein
MLFTLTYIFKSGKHQDKTVREVIDTDIAHMASIIERMKIKGTYERLDARTEVYFLSKGGDRVKREYVVSNNVKAGFKNKSGRR